MTKRKRTRALYELVGGREGARAKGWGTFFSLFAASGGEFFFLHALLGSYELRLFAHISRRTIGIPKGHGDYRLTIDYKITSKHVCEWPVRE